jgi:hypothetical protein
MHKDSKAPRKRAAPTKSGASRKTAPSVARPSTVKAATAAPSGGARRAVFIDVENTSSEAALIGALDQLGIDRAMVPTEVVAVGNWRVIGQHVARMLAQRGARLLHTAPATGVKDWSDLSIAVAAGIWLGRARPGDEIKIVSADRAFDAVADAAANLGVEFHRLTYGPLSGLAEAIARPEGAEPVARRSRRGGRRRRRGAPPVGTWGQAPSVGTALPIEQADRAPVTSMAAASVASSNGAPKDIQGATPEQIIATIARLTSRAPERGVNLDLLINALKAEGFGRPPGSPRLVTRLRKMKDVEVSPTGMVRLVSLPPGPLPMDLPPVSSAQPAPAAVQLPPPAELAPPSGDRKKTRPRGGRGRRRPKAAVARTSESSASEASG